MCAFEIESQFTSAWIESMYSCYSLAGVQYRAAPFTSADKPGSHAGGILWQLKGERVDALGADHARTENGRTIER